jgi:hypothetical protein
VADDDVEVRDVVEKVVVTGEPAFFTADDGGAESSRPETWTVFWRPGSEG